MYNSLTHIALYGGRHYGGINFQLGPSYGMLYNNLDFWIGFDHLFFAQSISRLIVQLKGELDENSSNHR